MRYYDAGSVYETPAAARFTKRLIFSGWRVVPKVVSSLISFEAERRAYAGRNHDYTADYGQRGGQRLIFRTAERTVGQSRSGGASGARRATSMTTFLLIWPSPSLAELGDPRRSLLSTVRPVTEVLADVAARISDALSNHSFGMRPRRALSIKGGTGLHPCTPRPRGPPFDNGTLTRSRRPLTMGRR